MSQEKKIKVLHIITRLDPGGSTTNTLETVARLDRKTYEVDLVAGRTDDPVHTARDFMAKQGITCRFVDAMVREVHPFKDLQAFIQLRQIIRDGCYDIVHTHSSKAGILGRWAAHQAGVGHIVHTPHGHIFYGYFSWPMTKFFLGVERAAARITTRLIALTPKGIEEHLALGVGRKEQWVAIPSGIDTEVFRLSIGARAIYRQLLGLEDEDIVLVCVARLEPIKNHRVLIDVAARLSTEFTHLKLLFVGEGAEKDDLLSYARERGVGGRVHCVGFRHDVALVLSACDIFVLASLNEGMGRSVLEAMAVGLPVVVSNAGGLPSIVTNEVEGIVVAPKDVHAWVWAVRSLLIDPALRLRLSRAAKKRVSDQYSVAAMVKQIEAVYAGL